MSFEIKLGEALSKSLQTHHKLFRELAERLLNKKYSCHPACPNWISKYPMWQVNTNVLAAWKTPSSTRTLFQISIRWRTRKSTRSRQEGYPLINVTSFIRSLFCSRPLKTSTMPPQLWRDGKRVGDLAAQYSQYRCSFEFSKRDSRTYLSIISKYSESVNLRVKNR